MTVVTNGPVVTALAGQIRQLAAKGLTDTQVGDLVGRAARTVQAIRSGFGIPPGVPRGGIPIANLPDRTPTGVTRVLNPLPDGEAKRLREKLRAEYERRGRRGYCLYCETWPLLAADGQRTVPHGQPAGPCAGSGQMAARIPEAS